MVDYNYSYCLIHSCSSLNYEYIYGYESLEGFEGYKTSESYKVSEPLFQPW